MRGRHVSLTPAELETAIKTMIIEAVGLEDIGPDDIDADAPLFGDGLGLDSIDALEIGLELHRRFGVRVSADSEEARRHFASVRSLAALVGGA
jgi:acyl carrier protein